MNEGAVPVVLIRGPRSFAFLVFSALWLAGWLMFTTVALGNVLTHGSGSQVRGTGYVPDGGGVVDDYLQVAFSYLLALPVVRLAIWNLAGWERISVSEGALNIDRLAFGVPVYRRERYAIDAISNLRDEGLPPKVKHPRLPWGPPSGEGALAFDYQSKTVKFGWNLLFDRDEARRVASEIRGLLPATHA